MSTVPGLLNSGASIPQQIEAQSPNLPKISTFLTGIANALPAGTNVGVTLPAAPVVPAPPAAFTEVFGKIPAAPVVPVPQLPSNNNPASPGGATPTGTPQIPNQPNYTPSGVSSRVVSYRGF